MQKNPWPTWEVDSAVRPLAGGPLPSVHGPALTLSHSNIELLSSGPGPYTRTKGTGIVC